MARQNSAKTPSIWKSALRAGALVSMPCRWKWRSTPLALFSTVICRGDVDVKGDALCHESLVGASQPEHDRLITLSLLYAD